MAAVDFLHHENPPTWAGVQSAISDAEGQRRTDHANQLDLARSKLKEYNIGLREISQLATDNLLDNLVALHYKYDFWHRTATAGSEVVQSGRPIFDDFFQHLWPYIGNNTANVVFQMVKRLWLIRIDQ
ncbi:adhesion G protein-coupled receptor B2 [Trichonephila clavipes]|nr:adhesion G protein-coupled receptor B2 [Trichonephila clavipes]